MWLETSDNNLINLDFVREIAIGSTDDDSRYGIYAFYGDSVSDDERINLTGGHSLIIGLDYDNDSPCWLMWLEAIRDAIKKANKTTYIVCFKDVEEEFELLFDEIPKGKSPE